MIFEGTKPRVCQETIYRYIYSKQGQRHDSSRASAISDQDMKEICDQLNNTPRKCLGWKTPAEVLREKMIEELR